MRTTTPLFLAGAIVIVGIFAANHLRYSFTVHAQSACDATSFSGAYGYANSGYLFDTQGNLHLGATAGRVVADGNGNLTGMDTASVDGVIARRTYKGTYSINGDCTGSVTFQTMAAGVSGTATSHGDIVVINNARQINYIQTDANFVFSGVWTRQDQ
jgi:hypothetical protein